MATTAGSQTPYTLVGVEKELDLLKNAVNNNLMHECKNYISIRLVTIIEQFFRIMKKLGKFGIIDVYHVKLYQSKSKKPKTMPKPTSLSILVDIFVHHGNQARIGSDAYKESIRDFCDNKNNNCTFNAMTYNVEFSKITDIRELVEYVLLGKYSQNVFEWIAVHTHSFQTVRVIKKYAGNLFDDDNTLEKYTRLFDARHSTVHTLSGRNPDTQWFDLVKYLFKTVKTENP